MEWCKYQSGYFSRFIVTLMPAFHEQSSKNSTVKKLFLTLVIGLSCLSIHAQQGFEAGGWIGVSNYFGDLNTTFDVSKPGIAGGLVGRYNFNNRVCLKLSANYGTLPCR